MELSSWSLRQRGYCHRIPDVAPSHALSGVHIPIIVIRKSGLTIIEQELELELEIGTKFQVEGVASSPTIRILHRPVTLR